jgi:stromal membrane-associated protein
VQAQPKAPEPENDLFSLDFHAPTSSFANPSSATASPPKKDVKQDILSLFSTTPAAPTTTPQANAFGQFQSSASPWDSFVAPQAQPQPTSMMGTNGVGTWGASSGWSAPAPIAPAQDNLWGNPASSVPVQKQPDLFGGDIWGGSSTVPGAGTDLWGSGGGAKKKDDAFGDIWGGFQ